MPPLQGNDESPLRIKSKAFAIRIVGLSRFLIENFREFIMSRQILRSGTSIGANLAEATGAQSLADFVGKLSIALKEAYDTRYWLEILEATNYLHPNDFTSLLADVNELIAMLNRSILTNK
ncbi:MAG: four helix bundle protein [Victivallales bacterium]|nr:four helix bundle protein [Victivallales bacterium]